MILEFRPLHLTNGNETPSSFPLPGSGPLIVSGVDQHNRKCFTSDWEQRTSALTCTYTHTDKYTHSVSDVAFEFTFSRQKKKNKNKYQKTSQREGEQMWSKGINCGSVSVAFAHFCTHQRHIYFPNHFPIMDIGSQPVSLKEKKNSTLQTRLSSFF